MGKRGELTISTIGTWILILLVLVVLLFIIIKFSGKGNNIVDAIRSFFRFGV